MIWGSSRKSRVLQNGKSFKMRLPTCAEWDALVEVTHGENSIMHWQNIFSWCKDIGPWYAAYRAVRGHDSVCCWSSRYAPSQHIGVGFRPAFEVPHSDSSISDGAVITVGTLYMGEQPVRVSQNPVWNGDIADYVPGAKMELREALENPAYQVRAIKAGNVFIADRVLVKNISWNDIQEAV